jgi:hypothetical protein
MPCYEVNTISVAFAPGSLALLQEIGATISASGQVATWKGVRVDLTRGQATGSQTAINALKRAYSAAAVRAVARRKGWTLTAVDENQYQAVKY